MLMADPHREDAIDQAADASPSAAINMLKCAIRLFLLLIG